MKMGLHRKCYNSTSLRMTHYPQNSRDAEMECLRLKSEIAGLKFELRGTQSRSLKSREIWQKIMEKYEQINQLRNWY